MFLFINGADILSLEFHQKCTLFFVELTTIGQEQLKNLFEQFELAICVKTSWVLIYFQPYVFTLHSRSVLVVTYHLDLI